MVAEEQAGFVRVAEDQVAGLRFQPVGAVDGRLQALLLGTEAVELVGGQGLERGAGVRLVGCAGGRELAAEALGAVPRVAQRVQPRLGGLGWLSALNMQVVQAGGLSTSMSSRLGNPCNASASASSTSTHQPLTASDSASCSQRVTR